MNKILEYLKDNYNLVNEAAAFDVLGASLVLSKSPIFTFNNIWVKSKEGDKFRNSSHDGGLDGINVDIDDSQKIIIIDYFQNSVGKNEKVKVEKSLKTIAEYFIEFKKIENHDFKDLEPYQNKIHLLNLKYSSTHTFVHRLNILTMKSFPLEKEKDYKETCKYSGYEIDQRYFGSEKLKVIFEKETKKQYKKLTHIVQPTGSLIEISSEKYESVACALSGNELRKLVEAELNLNRDFKRLFSDNVRGFLGSSEVNRDIRKTVKEEPDNFYFYNNGITILCSDFEKTNGRVKMINPRIINGQQSLSSIYVELFDGHCKVFDEIDTPLNVFVKIIKLVKSDDELIETNNICKTSNLMNKVEKIDLISNMPIMRELSNLYDLNGQKLIIKTGEVVENIEYLDDTNHVELQEILKIYYSIFLDKPNYAKKIGSIITDIYNAIYMGRKTIVPRFACGESKELYKEFEICESYLAIADDIHKNMADKVSSHALYVIFYMINKLEMKFHSIDYDIISVILKIMIDYEKEELDEQGKEYSHNNYFKSRRPIDDFKLALNQLEFKISA